MKGVVYSFLPYYNFFHINNHFWKSEFKIPTWLYPHMQSEKLRQILGYRTKKYMFGGRRGALDYLDYLI